MVRMIDLIKKGGSGDDEESPRRRSSREKSPPSSEEPLQMVPPGAFPQGGSGAKAPPRDKDAPGSAGEGSISLQSPNKKLGVKQRYCPYLGGRNERSEVRDFPVATNVCYAQESQEKKLLRTITLPYAPIPAQRQREFCLSTSYGRCQIYQAKERGSE